MKTIGLLGGICWKSTITYYQIINRYVNKKLGDSNSAKCIIYSVSFQPIEDLLADNNLSGCAPILCEGAKCLESAGADFIVICSNTMHANIDKIKEAVSIPVLHIAEVIALELIKNGIKKVGLIGTRFTMEENFYKTILEKHGIEVSVPDESARKKIDEIIMYELCREKFKKESKEFYLSVIDKLYFGGAQGVILGCTEIGLLIKQEDTAVLLFDTAKIHAESAAAVSLK